jgi:acyl-CoA synthetase (AMP-forming)/AMP-acid ligase II
MSDAPAVGGVPSTVAEPFDALSYLRANAEARGAELAVSDDGEERDFTTLLRAVVALMQDLRERGVTTGDVVAVALPNVWRYVALEIAIPAVGAVLLPMPLGLGRMEVISSLEGSGAVMAITDGSDRAKDLAEAAGTVPSVRTVVDAATLDTVTEHGEVEWHGPDPDRVVQIALTSGTTGPPKLASLTARLKQLTFEGFTSRLGFGPGDRMLPLSPITQGTGEMCLYALRTGAALIMSHDYKFDPAGALELAQRTRTTVLGGVPTIIARLLHSPALDAIELGHLRATISAGAPLSPAVAQAWEERTGSPTCSFYGAMDLGQLAVPSPDDPQEKRWTTVGRPHDRAEVLICDLHGAAVPAGTEGEICMRGPLVQERYWGEDAGPFAADGWAHFGDLGFIDADGFLHVTGRVKDIIIRGGSNINPFEVESVLRSSSWVSDACVVGRPDSDLGERAAAFVVPAAGAEPTLDDLRAHLEAEGLSRYKWPESLHLLEALPVRSTGKVDRPALRRRAQESAEG